jgi:superfamily II DNA or RNA helicase/HKD family nuclease
MVPGLNELTGVSVGQGELVPGVYERLVDRTTRTALEALADVTGEERALLAAEAPDRLAAHVAERLRATLLRTSDLDDQIALTQQILADLDAVEAVGNRSLRLDEPASLLTWIGPQLLPGEARPPLPLIPLSDSDLLVNAREEPRLGEALVRELETADRVDLLVAFIRFTGIRILLGPLRRLADRGVPMRVITTTYLGSTERRALDELRDLGAEVKVSYDTRSTRLHAKAWLLHRDSGYSTAFIGSSNLSRAALLDGLEWNVRLAQAHAPAVIDKVAATFEAYWADPEFEAYGDGDSQRFDAAIAAERTGDYDGRLTVTSGLEVRPWPYQQEILEAVDGERRRPGRWRNLVVAPTGTGKTVVAALDYRRMAEQHGDLSRQPSLLFVAHRKELLEQSLRTFREVQQDGSFGELLVGGRQPSEWRHVFASIQSLTAAGIEQIDPKRFDVVVVDEFHHAESATYRRLLDHLEPRVMVGMTATPERADGLDIKRWFDGRFAFEMRLWDALDQRLLSPFQYFGIADDTDLSQVSWRRGGYVTSDLSNVFTGDDARVAKVLRTIRELVADPREMRALGFCVSVEHAEYMARRFREAGIAAAAVTGETAVAERENALLRLKAGDLQVLFAVDLFNEGVDVPEIDTVLFLRPTESATVFLQQLGRGLRKSRDKACLTVLDFVGNQHQEFRFDLRFRALTGRSRRQLERDIQERFPYLPAGCHIALDRQVEKVVLDSVRRQLRVTTRSLVAELQQLRVQLGAVDLATFLDEAGVELDDLYKPSVGGWTALQRQAGIELPPAGPDEGKLGKRIGALTHLDDPERLSMLARLTAEEAALNTLDAREERVATMLLAVLLGEKEVLEDRGASLARLHEHPALCSELRELAVLLEDRAPHLPTVLSDLPQVPLQVHATYTRNEIAEAFGLKGAGWITGVRYDEATKSDLLLVTLNKSEEHYTPTTMYRDYVIARDRFHWESQSGSSQHTGAGQRYVERSSRPLLFMRFERTDPYLFIGQGDLESAQGDRPIAITWKLRTPLPEDVFQAARRVAG